MFKELVVDQVVGQVVALVEDIRSMAENPLILQSDMMPQSILKNLSTLETVGSATLSLLKEKQGVCSPIT